MTEIRGSGFRENFLRLQNEFESLMQRGGGTSENFRSAMFKILRYCEAEILRIGDQNKKLKEEIVFNEATVRAQDKLACMLVEIISLMSAQAKDGLSSSAPLDESPVSSRLSDKELLERICACGCQDEEDMKDCKCLCHEGKECSNAACKVCHLANKEDKIIILRKKKAKKKNAKSAD